MPHCSDIFRVPAWLEAARVSDSLCARAYAETPDPCRTALKTGIALADFHFGLLAGSHERSRSLPQAGYWEKERAAPADWALIVLDAKISAAALVSAAAILPLLAGVSRVIAVSIADTPAQEALMALEMCGVADIFKVKLEQFNGLVTSFARQAQAGRLVFCCALPALWRDAAYPVPWRRCDCEPKLLLLEHDKFSPQVLRFLYGQIKAGEPDAGAVYDAVFTSETANIPPCRLAITPGCEGFWLHAGLEPGFFRPGRICLGRMEEQADGMC